MNSYAKRAHFSDQSNRMIAEWKVEALLAGHKLLPFQPVRVSDFRTTLR